MYLVNQADALSFELECAIDNLMAVHSFMEDDQGANWQKSANAVFSVFLRLRDINKELQEAVKIAATHQGGKNIESTFINAQ